MLKTLVLSSRKPLLQHVCASGGTSLKRKDKQIEISSENKKIFDSLCKECKIAHQCAEHISEYLEDVLHWHPGEEEQLYLMLHINRLCAREDCNQ